MITNIKKHGFTSVAALASSLIGDLQTPMTLKEPASYMAGTTIAATFESKVAIDPLHADQAWRIRIVADNAEHLTIFAGTSIQLPDDGTIALLDNGTSRPGEMGSKPLNNAGGDKNIYFLNRAHLQASQKQAYPMSYQIASTNHGLSVFIWEPQNELNHSNYSWFAIQRPTQNVSGAPLIVGRCPVFCLYAIKRDATNYSGQGGTDDTQIAVDTDLIHKFVVREEDVLRPSASVDATIDTEDSGRALNAAAQVAITEDSKYVLTFPGGLNTSRFAYPNYELDMIAYSSADVISETSIAEISVYGEANPRKYVAHKANKIGNTGMRMFQIFEGTSANL